MPDDDKLDETIRREAKGYRQAGAPPADRMWSRIERDVARAIQPVRGKPSMWPWVAAGVGMAATLVIGVAIGRRSTPDSVVPSGNGTVAAANVATSADSVRIALMRAATLSHFSQVEVFLTEVRADLRTGRDDTARDERSRQLLARTRLIMANDAGRAPAVGRLLQDLELVLAEIAALPDSGARRPADVRLLDERLRVGTVLPRLRTILPSPVGGN